MRFRSLRDDDVDRAAAIDGTVHAQRFRTELDNGMFRREWTWIAEDAGRMVARAVWWGRADGVRPLVLECLWVDDSVHDRSAVAGDLLSAAHRGFRQRCGAVPEAFVMTVPNDWHSDPAARAAVAWRRDALAAVGFTHEVRRLRFEWTPDIGVADPDGRLVFSPEPDDATMLDVFRRIGDGSLDDETRKNRARMSPDETARREMGFYLRAPGRREWWRTAHTSDGALAGLAVPSATSYHPNVGYLGVVPEQRGRGLVRQILDEITRGHAGRGAERITATTDVTNVPMATAFRAAGYRNTETRVQLTAP
ncbi:GNAT family N-acetyltransferase [Actinoplanes sp. NEAU-A12]|uniref:GNAT family N-acetyltransferase n=1 Tax=Actinoplanes sandaracinus TaxID=3045177 RepID=A0ABT6WVC0_9ACTN|nr:GNAT family N-acetyltransferase [Actinoplanes sandaracinus]MDI6103696.1 GNAT family N-acetyltransferase [Actinoplanes sandaracinus]